MGANGLAMHALPGAGAAAAYGASTVRELAKAGAMPAHAAARKMFRGCGHWQWSVDITCRAPAQGQGKREGGGSMAAATVLLSPSSPRAD